MMLSTVFYHPLRLTYSEQLWFVLPLCIAVAIVYKAIRCKRLRRLPLEVLALVAYMAVGLAVLGAGLWAFQRYWP